MTLRQASWILALLLASGSLADEKAYQRLIDQHGVKATRASIEQFFIRHEKNGVRMLQWVGQFGDEDFGVRESATSGKERARALRRRALENSVEVTVGV